MKVETKLSRCKTKRAAPILIFHAHTFRNFDTRDETKNNVDDGTIYSIFSLFLSLFLDIQIN